LDYSGDIGDSNYLLVVKLLFNERERRKEKGVLETGLIMIVK
jgi:hypothetical protein